MQKRWSVKQNTNKQAISHLADALGIDIVLSSLLVQRGITNYEDARCFFRPDYRHLHDPFLMMDMENAITRI
jgi:single-stranded-DNA-specific exonuclease